MGLSPARITRLARQAEGMFGTTLGTWSFAVRTTMRGSETPTIYPTITGHKEVFREQWTGLNVPAGSGQGVPRQDMQLRIATDRVTWTPSKADSVTEDATGLLWRIVDIFDGPGYPFYRFQIRKMV